MGCVTSSDVSLKIHCCSRDTTAGLPWPWSATDATKPTLKAFCATAELRHTNNIGVNTQENCLPTAYVEL
jgi:hypothetical protein